MHSFDRTFEREALIADQWCSDPQEEQMIFGFNDEVGLVVGVEGGTGLTVHGSLATGLV